MNPERPWRVVVSCLLSGVALAIGGMLWWLPIPQFWQLATGPITGPIHPMGPMGFVVMGIIISFIIDIPLCFLAVYVSQRPAALVLALAAVAVVLLQFLNIVAFFVIVFARSMEIAPS